MKHELSRSQPQRAVIIGAGMAGLSAAISLASKGEEVVLLEACDYPGGKMRELKTRLGGVDSGPTVFTMKYVFEELFELAGESFDSAVPIEKAKILARHAWDKSGTFDLHASRGKTAEEISNFFDTENAHGYLQFCKDGKAIFDTLKDSFIGAPRPSPFELSSRVGLTNFNELWRLQPFTSLMSRLEKYFPDPRLQQLFGRYATYVGSSPYKAPATLMLIAHVEQEGVWLIEGGMYRLALAMSELAKAKGAEIRNESTATEILIDQNKACGVITQNGEIISARQVLYCGDVSGLPDLLPADVTGTPKVVQPKDRSLSALTWSMEAKVKGFDLHRHTVFFSDDYKEEFQSIFERNYAPVRPTVYVCAQDRGDSGGFKDGTPERLMCLVNSPANGDTNKLSERELETCQLNMERTLERCGAKLNANKSMVTQPADFHRLFPGSGGALYGRASHGWMASFARPGAQTKIPGLYLAGGSVHPGAGVPMATRSGMLAAEQIIADRVLT